MIVMMTKTSVFQLEKLKPCHENVNYISSKMLIIMFTFYVLDNDIAANLHDYKKRTTQ